MSIWTVEGEEVIVLGDTATHGGKVITASSNIFYNNIPVARVGDEVTCPKCNGTHTIVSGASSVRGNSMHIARNGDNVSCGARLISGSGTVDGMTAEAVRLSDPEVYDEQIVSVDARTGEPIGNYPYFIETEDGRTFMGRTDEHGRTQRIKTDGPIELTAYWGEEAVLKGAL